jgi:hypothetical protein
MMKKVLLIAAVGAFGLSLNSCTKDYTCSYESGGFTFEAECNSCNKDQVKELEDAGYTCEAN